MDIPPKRKLTSRQISFIIGRGRVTIDQSEENFIQNNNVVISNFEMDEEIVISNYPEQARDSLIFQNCFFKQSFSTDKYGNIEKYVFINCVFEGNFSILHLVRVLEIKDGCIFKKNVNIEASNAKDSNLTNSTFHGRLAFKGSFSQFNLNLINLSHDFKGCDFEMNNVTIHYFKIEKSKFNSVKFINNTIFRHEVEVFELETTNLTLNHVEIGLKIDIKKSIIDSFIIDNIRTNHRHFNLLDDCKIKNASIALHQIDKIQIAGSMFDIIKFWGINDVNSIVIIENIFFKELIFDSIVNKGSLTLRDITANKDSILKIKSSNFRFTDFIKCNFSSAIMEFENSKITEVFLSETDFPKRVQKNNIDNPSQAQLAFGQLQTAFQKQGDSIRALEYHSREVAAHFRNISLFSNQFFTKVNLFLNLISNNFGRSWWIGVIFTFILGVIFFFLILTCAEEYPRITIDERISLAFLKFMNPIRSFDTESLFKTNAGTSFLNLKTGAYILDFFGKILIAYGYYQTIQAFRRFGRK